MGNTLGGKKSAKVMKITGETFKLKTPVQAGEVVKDYPGHVLLESEAVKHFGVRAMPLEAHQELKPKRLYFLVELPKFPEEKAPRRVRSGINMSAKDRLESLMLSRRSASDLSVMRPSGIVVGESKERATRVKMRLPKAEVAKLMMQSKDEGEAAEKIMELCVANRRAAAAGGVSGGAPPDGGELGSLLHQQVRWKAGHGGVRDGFKAREVCNSFL
ncbi:uncharacterized protein At1g66480-like [Cornus florida]|uniref:uncharacterized protein At1g66480-like n=1 Tax=Cornus florida TaxID=4283 RepID=UPI0028974E4F|nr:uncharacterized protein At1g66480-like [Cornus florida]XP_059645885.1 uncharacterized protein At1g66480-like [Cornus florida]